MTVTKTTANIKTYTGDGVTTVFAYDFLVLADEDIKVQSHVIATGVNTTLTLTTDYTVSGAGNASGGNVTLTDTYESTHKIIITREMDYTQPTDLTENDDVPSEVYEAAIDRMCLEIQQLRDLVNSALSTNSGETEGDAIYLPILSEGYLYWNGSEWVMSSGPTGTTTDYSGTMDFGTDASKDATPDVGDIYWATDTNITYVCNTNNVWTPSHHIWLGSGEEFRIYDSSDTEIAVIDENGNMQIDGDLDVTGTITSTGNIQFVIDGGGSAITTGIKGSIQIPWACTITAATVLADQSCTLAIDIWKDTYANFPPDNSDSITAAAPPTITADTDSTDSTLTGWTTAVTANDILSFNVDSNDNATFLTLILEYSRT
ncbi:hypothetical protein ACFL3D_01815 [Candidatus Omnitrophota bacterium]